MRNEIKLLRLLGRTGTKSTDYIFKLQVNFQSVKSLKLKR